ncbi:ATP-binding protein [Limnobacter sp.]|uniref:ATP-binding protein n=1 Tax=Limnobacter sp. TaxID=2003368 RepID=UPI003513E508
MFVPRIRASFSIRLVLGSLLVLLLLSIPLAFSGYSLLKDQTTQKAGGAAQLQAEHIAQAVNRNLLSHLNNLVFTMKLEELHGDHSPAQQTRVIELMQSARPGYLWIGVAAPDGTVLAANDDLLVGKNVGKRPWFKRGLEEPAVMDVHEASLLAALLPSRKDEKYQFIDFTAPLRDPQGNVIAVYGIHLDWKDFILEIQTDVFGRLSENTPTLILASDGSLRLGNRVELSDMQEDARWEAMPGFSKALNGQSSWSIETLPDGQDYLVAFSPINGSEQVSGLGWISVTLTPLNEINSPVSMALMYAVGALVLGTAVTLLMVLALGRGLSRAAQAYLAKLRSGASGEALRSGLTEMPLELQGISRQILDINESLKAKSEKLEVALAAAKESYWVVEALIVQAPVPLAMLDTQMNYVAASSRWVSTFTQSKGSLVGKNHYEVVPNLHERWRQAHRAGLEGQSLSATSDPWIAPNGETIWLDWAIEPWQKPDGTRGGIIIMCKDVSREHEMRDSLAESEERFKLAMEGSRDGLWDLRLDQNTVYFSPSWKRLLGYEDHELANHFSTWERLTAPMDLELAKAHLAKCLEDPECRHFEAEFRMAHRDGHWVHILSTAMIVRDSEGKAVRVVGTHLDKTRQLELEERLREASIAAMAERESNAEKSRFLATFSHELRTPLNGVIGFAKLLHMDLPPGEHKEQAGHLVQTADTLASLLNDILDFSKMESGMVTLNQAPFLLNTLLGSSTELPRMNCQSKDVAFELDKQVPENTVYLGDMGRLRQVIQNLLSNAIKFTSQGKVRLQVNSISISGDTDLLHVAVQDTGLGIPKEKQASLFQPFVQVHTDHDNRFGGTGLGLSIVKTLIEAMRGEIHLESEPGVGTTISFSVPLKRASLTEQEASNRVEPVRALHVLVADDTPLNVKLLRTFLERDGHRVTVAEDGLSALQMAEQHPYDFILMDIDMPKLSGLEVAKRVRQGDGPNRHTKMAALTGYAFEEDVKASMEAGMDYHFAKPIEFELLLNQLALHSRQVA